MKNRDKSPGFRETCPDFPYTSPEIPDMSPEIPDMSLKILNISPEILNISPEIPDISPEIPDTYTYRCGKNNKIYDISTQYVNRQRKLTDGNTVIITVLSIFSWREVNAKHPRGYFPEMVDNMSEQLRIYLIIKNLFSKKHEKN
jgi:hypothetical protein